MTIREFAIRAVTFGILCGALLVSAGFWNNSRGQIRNEYLGAHKDKAELLRSCASPRVVFVGGSSVAFGVDGALFRSQMGRNTVNLGLHAGLGSNLILNQAADQFREGDIVVVSLEYELFSSSACEIEETARVLMHSPSMVLRFSPADVKHVLDGGISFLRCMAFPPPQAPGSSVYARDAFNEDGDLMAERIVRGHSNAVLRDISREKFRWNETEAVRVCGLINRLEARCRTVGACLCFAFPAVPEELIEKKGPELQRAGRRISEILICPVLGSPIEQAQPLEDFFDTRYHLNADGRYKHSTRLIEALQLQLASDTHH